MSNSRPSLRSRQAARRRARRRRMMVRCAGVVVCAGLLAVAGWKIAGAISDTPASALAAVQPTPTPAPTPAPTATPEPLPVVSLAAEDTSSNYALLARASDGTVIWSKGEPTDTVWPASITKVLTALVALEHLPDLDASGQGKAPPSGTCSTAPCCPRGPRRPPGWLWLRRGMRPPLWSG